MLLHNTKHQHQNTTGAKEYMGIEEEGTEKKNAQKESNTKKRNYHEWKEADHPGCQITGHLMLDRVPGNFHILARSKHHDLAPHLTNVSHQVNSLTIGDPYTARIVSELANSKNAKGGVPQEVSSKMAPMNGNLYTTYNLHESYHHYLKVVSTNVPEHSNSLKQKETKAYQIIPSSQLSYYRKDMVPEAKFVYDLSPISVTYRTSSRQWYEYMTSLFAIIGGVFTMVGLIESSIQATVSKVNTNRRRSSSHRTSSSSSSSARY